jgi:hypothetical protein
MSKYLARFQYLYLIILILSYTTCSDYINEGTFTTTVGTLSARYLEIDTISRMTYTITLNNGPGQAQSQTNIKDGQTVQ